MVVVVEAVCRVENALKQHVPLIRYQVPPGLGYDFEQDILECMDTNSCRGYTISNCSAVYCTGKASCQDATVRGGGGVACWETYACQHATLHITMGKPPPPPPPPPPEQQDDTNDKPQKEGDDFFDFFGVPRGDDDGYNPVPDPDETISCGGGDYLQACANATIHIEDHVQAQVLCVGPQACLGASTVLSAKGRLQVQVGRRGHVRCANAESPKTSLPACGNMDIFIPHASQERACFVYDKEGGVQEHDCAVACGIVDDCDEATIKFFIERPVVDQQPPAEPSLKIKDWPPEEEEEEEEGN